MDDANVAWRVADDEAVVLHADTSAYFGLNRTGTILWARLAEQPMTLDELVTWVRERFPDAPADPADEIAAFIDQMSEEALLLSEPSSGADPTAATDSERSDELPPWEAPVAERFGELEKLILSGE